MAILTDPSIPLQVRPVAPPPDTSGDFLKALQLRQQAQEFGLQKQQATDTHAIAQQNIADKQRSVDVRNALAQAYKDGTVVDPATGKATLDPEKFFASATKSGFGPEADTQRKADLQALLQNHTTQLDNEKKRVALLGNAAGSIASIADPAQQDQAIQAQLPQLVQAGLLPPEAAQKIAAMPPGPQRQAALIQFRDQATDAEKQVDQHAASLRDALSRLKTNSDLATAEAELPGKKAESTIKTAEATALNASPEDAAAKVGGIINPAKNPDRFAAYLSQYNSATTLEQKNAVLRQAQEEAGSVSRETNPDIAAAKARAAQQTEAAKAPIETARALTVARTNRAMAAAEKLDAEYNTAKTSAEQIGRLLDLIDKGNKAAGSTLPVLNAEALNAIEGIKRMNKTDIEQAGGTQAGSLYDRLAGYSEKQLKGDSSIVPEIRENIRALQQAMGEGAYQKYTEGLKSIAEREKVPEAGMPTHEPVSIRKGAKAQIPDSARAQLKEGVKTTFGNGQIWTLKNGQPEQVK